MFMTTGFSPLLYAFLFIYFLCVFVTTTGFLSVALEECRLAHSFHHCFTIDGIVVSEKKGLSNGAIYTYTRFPL